MSLQCRTVGGVGEHVTEQQLDEFVAERFADVDVDDKDVVLVVPDGTRSCPLPMLVRVVHRHLVDRVRRLTAVIALGTHSYMSDEAIDVLFIVGGEGQPESLAQAYPGLTESLITTGS